MQAFFTRCPELAENEIRSFEPAPGYPLPRDWYFLFELFCPAAACDCRRVVFLVARRSDDRVVATLNYGWESVEFYRRWAPNDPAPEVHAGVYIDPTGVQSRWSSVLKATLEWILANDPAYRARIVRHYELFKAAGSPPSGAKRAAAVDARRPSLAAAPVSDVLSTTVGGALPASQQLAKVSHAGSGRLVHLPPAFARQAVERFFSAWLVFGKVLEGPRPPEDGLPGVGPDEWLVLVPERRGLPLPPPVWERRPRGDERFLVTVLPRNVMHVSAGGLRSLLTSLEEVKPEEVDANGRPHPWVAPLASSAGDRAEHGDDDVVVGGAAAATAPDDTAGADTERLPTRVIAERFEALCKVAGLGTVPLTVRRGGTDRRGFVTGRITMTPQGQPAHVAIVTCPNADLAEVLSTLTHELVHAIVRAPGHAPEFRAALVNLAGRAFGTAYFGGARARAGGPSRILDQWVGSGIRASIEGREPPSSREPDDAQLARAIRKVAKLRRLAADQVGRPEGIAATGQANDLVVAYGLETFDVGADAVPPGQMLDRWLVLGGVSRWRHRLADVVADWFDVFALSLRGRMHLFGRHADLIATEYLYAVCAGRIHRACDEYLAAWKQQARRPPGASARERAGYCGSAVAAFAGKLEKRRTGPKASIPPDALARAEEFARGEHEKRGLRWSSAPGARYVKNAAGAELGRSLEIVRGVDGSPGGPKLLESGSTAGLPQVPRGLDSPRRSTLS